MIAEQIRTATGEGALAHVTLVELIELTRLQGRRMQVPIQGSQHLHARSWV